MSDEELLRRPAGELAALIRGGELRARELIEASLRRIEAVDPVVNAFTHVDAEGALAAADAVAPGDPRPFAGVPIAVKDNRAVAGMPLTMCSSLWADVRPPFDSFLVRRLREAGFVIVGKTAMPENGILPTTESRANGATANPWDLSRTPGGSSGGAAAAVAAAMVPIAHGNDGGGSIRIPAACCGLVGLKPARGRVSVGPEAGHSFLVSDGVLTRSVAETAAALDVLAGYEPGDASWAPPPERPFTAALEAEPRGLRIGLALNPPLDGATLDPVCRGAAEQAAELLAGLGHTVEPVTPPWSGHDLLPDFTRAFGPLTAQLVQIGGMLRGRPATEEDVEPLTWSIYQHALTTGSLDYLQSQGRLETVARQVVAATSAYDAILTPALASLPIATGAVHGRGPDPWGNFQRSGYFTPFTAIANITGQPAIALPLYEHDGLPLAVQLIGRPADEFGLLALSAQLERAAPWADRRPPTVQ